MASENRNGWDPLQCNCLAYRVASGKNWKDKVSGKPLNKHFLRRNPLPDGTKRDVKGLSVNLFLVEKITPTQISERIIANFNDCHAIGSLHVGKIRDIEASPPLDVIRDATDHANITGLPYPIENPEIAERLASKLADQFRVVWEKEKK